jgi:hypothetical protein
LTVILVLHAGIKSRNAESNLQLGANQIGMKNYTSTTVYALR